MRVVVLAVALASFAAPAAAQLPFPMEEEKPKKKQREKEPEKEPEKRVEKTYTKPDRKLPEGEAKVLEGPIAVIEFDGVVNPGMGEFTIDAIERAQKENKQALLIEINTPGGAVDTTQEIIQAMLPAKIPIIVYVTPSGSHAASAGTFITLAGHVAAMAPATRIGAAHPVLGQGEDPEEAAGKHMARKIENDLVALVEGIARERNRNVEWAKDAVIESVSATEEKALEIGAIDFIARDRAELIEKLEGHQVMVNGVKVELRTKGVAIVDYQQSTRSWLLNMLASPGIIMILMLIGIIGIAIEFQAPGLFVPGIVGVISLLLAVIAAGQLPIDLGGVLLLLIGVGLMVAEFFTPTFGVLAVVGGILMAIGFVLLIDPANPDYAIDPSFRISPWDVIPGVGTLMAFVFFLSYYVVRTRKSKPTTGSEALLGAKGRVLRPVGPEGGQVFIAGEYWMARSPEPIEKDVEVEVRRVDGLWLDVVPVSDPKTDL